MKAVGGLNLNFLQFGVAVLAIIASQHPSHSLRLFDR